MQTYIPAADTMISSLTEFTTSSDAQQDSPRAPIRHESASSIASGERKSVATTEFADARRKIAVPDEAAAAEAATGAWQRHGYDVGIQVDEPRMGGHLKGGNFWRGCVV